MDRDCDLIGRFDSIQLHEAQQLAACKTEFIDISSKSGNVLNSEYEYYASDEDTTSRANSFTKNSEDAEKATFDELQLIDAVRFKRLDDVVRLLAKGTDINACHQDGRSLLAIAAANGDAAMATLLLDSGARIDTKCARGRTPLMHAVSGKGTEVVKILVKRGADVNARDEDGVSLIHEAARIGCKEIVKTLLDAGKRHAIYVAGDENTTCDKPVGELDQVCSTLRVKRRHQCDIDGKIRME